jgi:hypothetical protein
MPKPITIEPGQKFDRLTVVTSLGVIKSHSMCEVLCDCGKVKIVTATSLKNGKTRSCGCLKIEGLLARSSSHCLSKTPLYSVWKDMMRRCLNPESHEYKNYGERGITVCDAWRNPETFIAECPAKPDGPYHFDRIENDGNYEPGNVRWSTRSESMRNVRHNLWIDYNGQRRLLIEVAEELGIRRDTLRARIFKNDPAPFRPTGT